MMRVSTLQLAQNSLLGITDAYSRLSIAQNIVDTGKQVQKPSDDPSGTAQALSFQEQISEIDQYDKNMDQANGFLSTSSTALSSITSLTRQARTIAVQGGSGNTSAETYQALSGQVQNIITQIGNLGNTTYGSLYVFAGQRTNTPPFVGAGQGFNYQGGTAITNDADINLTIGRGEALKVNATGDQVISPLITALGKLRDDLSSGAAPVISQNDISALDTQINNLLSVNADMGAKIQRIQQNQTRNALTKDNFTQFISNIVDADVPKAVIGLQTAQTAYQAAVQSTGYSFQSSLLNFLR